MGKKKPKYLHFNKEQTFGSLFGLDRRIFKAIAKQGFIHPTLVQSRCIPHILAGKDLLAKAKTGSGKTLAYAVPVLQKLLVAAADRDGERSGVGAVILVPTKELCSQVTEQLRRLSFYCSDEVPVLGVSAEVAAEVQAPLLQDLPSIIVATPTRLLEHCVNGTVSLKALEILVLDEADLVLSYGYDDDVKKLLRFLPKLFQCCMLSATLSPQLDALKALVLNNPAIVKVKETKKEEKLKEFYVTVPRGDKTLLLYALLKFGTIKGKTLLFVNSVDSAFRLKLLLEQFSITSVVLNSELPYNSRRNMISQFNMGMFDYLIATDEGLADEDDDSQAKARHKRRRKQGTESDSEGEEEESDEGEGEQGDWNGSTKERGEGGDEVNEDESDDNEGNDKKHKKKQKRRKDNHDDSEESGDNDDGDNTKKKKKEKKSKEASEDEDTEDEGDAEEGDDVDPRTVALMNKLEALGEEEEGDDDDDDDDDDDEEEEEEAEEEKLMKQQAAKRDKAQRKTRRRNKDFGVARGVDFQDVATVVNVDFPLTVKAYTHRVGRTARGGKAGEAVSLVGPTELQRLQMVLDHQKVANAAPTQLEAAPSLTPLPFKMEHLERFRYRLEDVSRAVTKLAVREARLKELKQEMLNSEKLQSHFEDNPRERLILQHDRICRPAQIQQHLKKIPAYLVPDNMSIHNTTGKRTKKQRRRRRQKDNKEGGSDPLKTFSHSRKTGKGSTFSKSTAGRLKYQESHKGAKKRKKKA